jgi:hypothetical protein
MFGGRTEKAPMFSRVKLMAGQNHRNILFSAVAALAVLTIVILTAQVTPADAQCAPGQTRCPSGGCAPAGWTCCAKGKTAPPGHHCCVDGTYCSNDAVCSRLGESECISRSSIRVCPDRKSYCDPGFMCTRDNTCLSTSSARYCGERSYCEQGYVCIDNQCKFDDSQSSRAFSGPARGGRIADACLVVETKRVNGAIGECTKKNGSKDQYYITTVRSSGAQGCPQIFEFDYVDTDSGRTAKQYTPLDIQICGGPPASVKIGGR